MLIANFGSLSLEEILLPVINQAKKGILVTYDLNKAIESSPQLKNDPESKKIYFLDNKPLPENYLMKRPDLANTLTLIAENGKEGFYKGEVANKFIKAMKANNGLFEQEDLDTYQAKIRMPIVASYRNNTVFTSGPSPQVEALLY